MYEMSSTTSGATIDKLRSIFASYGLPEELLSDNGPRVVSEDIDIFFKRNGIKHTLNLPYHDASNGAAERTVQTVKQAVSSRGVAVVKLQGPGLKGAHENFAIAK